MNTAELIYQESQILPENLRMEVLDFIGYLKSRHAVESESMMLLRMMFQVPDQYPANQIHH